MLTTIAETGRGNAVLRLSGVLHSHTYLQARDAMINAALDRTSAVIVNIDGLEVPDDYSWAVFASARWHVHHWPDVTIALSCSDPAIRHRLSRMSVSRYVPVYASVATAERAIGDGNCRYRRRALMHIDPDELSTYALEMFVRDHLLYWSMDTKFPEVMTVASIFVENALHHTSSGCSVRLESTDDDVVVAVADAGAAPAMRRERMPGDIPTGLDIVAALCSRWGSSPTTMGKTVWAQISPDDKLAAIAKLLQ